MKKAVPLKKTKYLELAKQIQKSNQFKIASNALAYNTISQLCIDQSYVMQQPFVFSHDILPKTLTITNQNQSGRCWLFSALNMIRAFLVKKWNVSNVELSQSYLAFWDKFERCNKYLEDVIKTSYHPLTDRSVDDLLNWGIGDGGFFEYAVNIIEKYGVVPSEVMPDSFSAKNTQLLNKLVNRKLKIATVQLRKHRLDAKKVAEIKEGCLRDLLKVLTRAYGPIPQAFKYTITADKKSKQIAAKSPLDFYQKHVNFSFDSYLDLICNPVDAMKKNQRYELEDTRSIIESENVVVLNVEMSVLKLCILATLLDNKPLWFACDVTSHGDRNKGIWDFQAFNYEQLFGINLNQNRIDLINSYQIASNHAMSLVGFNLDEAQTKMNQKQLLKDISKYKNNVDKLVDALVKTFAIDRWKIENSWGDKYGSKGFFVMTDAWFNQFVSQAIVCKKALKTFLNKQKHVDQQLWNKLKKVITYEKLVGKYLKTTPILYSKYAPLSFKVNQDETSR